MDTMDYKEKFEKLIQRIDDLIANGLIDEKADKAILKDFTVESEDERIRKWLIEGMKNLSEKSLFFSDIPKDKVIAWLEKQGEQNEQNFWEKCKHCECFDGYDLCLHKKNFGSVTNESKENCKNNNFFIEKQVGQKLPDKVKPKFKVGDWVVNDYNTVVYIESITETNYILQCKDGYHERMSIGYIDKCWHLWTIQDAKDGDVLYHKNPLTGIEYIVMSKGINGYGNIDSYFRYNSEDGFGIYIPSVFKAKLDDITPATKEQRNFLFQEMKEAGYKWNVEKKELKKIEQKPAWSEEDENMLQKALSTIRYALSIPADKEDDPCFVGSSTIFWLKSLREKLKGE